MLSNNHITDMDEHHVYEDTDLDQEEAFAVGISCAFWMLIALLSLSAIAYAVYASLS